MCVNCAYVSHLCQSQKDTDILIINQIFIMSISEVHGLITYASEYNLKGRTKILRFHQIPIILQKFIKNSRWIPKVPPNYQKYP